MKKMDGHGMQWIRGCRGLGNLLGVTGFEPLDVSVPKSVNDGSIYPTNERQQKNWSRAGSSQGKSLSVNPSRHR